MSNTRVLKHPFRLGDTLFLQSVKKILHFDFQYGQAMVWTETYASGDGDSYIVVLICTGEEVPEGYEHFSSAVRGDGDYVLHLYVRKVNYDQV